MTYAPVCAERQPTPVALLRYNQRYYRRHPIMEAEASLLRAWRRYQAWAQEHSMEEETR